MVRVSSPGETQTMVRVNCQNGDGGGSRVGESNTNFSSISGYGPWWWGGEGISGIRGSGSLLLSGL